MGSDDQDSDRTGFLGPEFAAQRANPMPVVPPSAVPAQTPIPVMPPAPGADEEHGGPGPLDEDRWQMGRPDAGRGRSRLAIVAGAIALVVALVAGLLLFAPKGAEGQTIAYGFQKGQNLNYRMTASMQGQVSMEGQGAPVQMSMEMGGVIRMKVLSVDPAGVATVQLKLEDVYLRSDPAVETSVPSNVTQQVKIAPDGRIVEGSLGLSELGATSQAPPGWDQYSPMLPEEPVAPGDKWSDEVEVPFIGNETITVSSDTQLLDYVVEDGEQVAVIKSDITVPLDVEVSLSDLAKEMGTSAAALGLPGGADPKFAYEGSMDMVMTARVSPQSQELKGTVMEGSMVVDMTVHDMPGLGDLGPIKMDLDMSITMEGFQARKAKPEQAA